LGRLHHGRREPEESSVRLRIRGIDELSNERSAGFDVPEGGGHV
jgi:hypothetical protein